MQKMSLYTIAVLSISFVLYSFCELFYFCLMWFYLSLNSFFSTPLCNGSKRWEKLKMLVRVYKGVNTIPVVVIGGVMYSIDGVVSVVDSGGMDSFVDSVIETFFFQHHSFLNKIQKSQWMKCIWMNTRVGYRFNFDSDSDSACWIRFLSILDSNSNIFF